MSNQRSVMTEFRFLDQKRQAEGLTAEEATRYAQLRDLVGPETAGPPRSGFDVNAAAARLRESLLPAGLRNRPAEAAPPPPAPPPAPEPPAAALALEQAWAEAPFAELTPAPADPLFEPGSLAQEVRPQAWNPEAPGYDPDAPYDEAAWIAAGYDPTATYDWSAYGYGPDGQPLPADAAAAPAEGAAEAQVEPPLELAEPPAELLEQPLEVAEQPLGGELPASPDAGWEGVPVETAPEAAPAEPPAAMALETSPEQPWDVSLVEPAPPEAGVEQAWGAPAPEPEPEPALDGLEDLGPAAAPEPVPAATAPAEAPLPFDPDAPFDHAKWFGRPAVAPPPEAAPELEALPPADAAALADEPDLSFDLGEPLEVPAAPAFGEYDEAAAPPAVPDAPDLLAAAELAPAEPLPDLPPSEPGPELAAPGADPATGWFADAPATTHEPAPAGAPFGEYDEAGAPLPGGPAEVGLEAMLPFDPAAASAIEPGALPEGYDPGGPSLDPSTLPPADLGGYDDAAGFSSDQLYGGPEGDALPGGAPLELGEAVPDWQPDAALEQGFELASDGSFGFGAPPSARTPAWGTAVAAVPAEGWESTPALDLGGPFESPSLTPEQPLEAVAPEAPAVEELPTIDGAELLEELPPEAAAPAPLAAPEASFGPAPTGLPDPGLTALDGAFEEEAAVEAAAYPPPDLAEPFAELPPEGALAEPPAPEPEPAVSYDASPTDLPPEIVAAYADASPVPGSDASAGVAPGLASDTFELPPAVAEGLFEPSPEPEPLEVEPLPPPPPTVQIPGSHRVVLHTVDGQVKRGLLVDALLDAPALPLQGQVATEEIPTGEIKAIFFMLAPGEKAPAPEGKKVRVTFRDGRQVAGFSPDYQEGLVGFFMIPADTRTNTGRIWVYQAAVKAVAVS